VSAGDPSAGASELPTTTQIRTRLQHGVLHLTLARPEARNAMSNAMIDEIAAVFDAVRDRPDVRAIVLRGEGGNFCAGGDVKDMAASRAAPVGPDGSDPVAVVNRRFGTLMMQVDRAPQATVAVLEGAVLGGGFGLACVADVAIARADASFGLPETGLGFPPAQIAAFLVRRIGVSSARRLAVTGGRFDGRVALELGVVHHVVVDEEGVARALDGVLAQIRRCAPGAIAATKQIMANVDAMALEDVLDDAAARFAKAVRGPEGTEGTIAFVGKRLPSWAQEPT
jgi:isohexenylglutaconyl-CoA hydratase